ncbi:MAG TPA: hypothetical protein VMY37_05725 [Thermoguttaceae bacterium]|nr:hypothetical protein [Thermoguttaceae bacterium]
MDPDAPSTSPFPTPPPDSPSRPEPEQPRLGISHLLVWTACVAAYFSVARAFSSPDWVPRLELSLVLAVGLTMGRATALGGLLLWVARRYRHLPFPGQPGETLLVLLGIYAAQVLLQYPIHYGAELGTIPRWAPGLFSDLAVLLIAVLYLIAAVRTKILRWRVYFITVLVAGAIMVLLLLSLPLAESLLGPTFTAGRRLLPFVPDLPRVLPGAVLLFVAVKDARQGRRYRWTHWLGIGIGLWNGLIGIPSAAWVTWTVLAL